MDYMDPAVWKRLLNLIFFLLLLIWIKHDIERIAAFLQIKQIE